MKSSVIRQVGIIRYEINRYYWKEGLRNIFKHGFMSVAAVVIMVEVCRWTGTVTLVAYNITNNT